MNERDHIDLLRYLSGEMTDDEKKGVEQRLASDPDLRASLDHLQRVEGFLASGRETSFGPSFADRVMERIGQEEREGSQAEQGGLFGDLLLSIFGRLAPVALVAALVLGVYNITTAEDGLSPIEATFGLEPVDIAGVYDVMIDDVESGSYEFDDDIGGVE